MRLRKFLEILEKNKEKAIFLSLNSQVISITSTYSIEEFKSQYQTGPVGSGLMSVEPPLPLPWNPPTDLLITFLEKTERYLYYGVESKKEESPEYGGNKSKDGSTIIWWELL